MSVVVTARVELLPLGIHLDVEGGGTDSCDVSSVGHIHAWPDGGNFVFSSLLVYTDVVLGSVSGSTDFSSCCVAYVVVDGSAFVVIIVVVIVAGEASSLSLVAEESISLSSVACDRVAGSKHSVSIVVSDFIVAGDKCMFESS